MSANIQQTETEEVFGKKDGTFESVLDTTRAQSHPSLRLPLGQNHAKAS